MLPNAKRDALPKPEPREEQVLSRQGNSPPPHLQPVADVDLTLDIPEADKPPIMEQRRYTTTAWRQLGSAVHYCFPRGDKPIDDDEGEELHVTDPDLLIWRDDLRKQKLNAAVFLQQGVIEVTFFGPDQTLNEAFFQACSKVGIAPRFAIGRRSGGFARSILFKLRDDEAKRLDDEYSASSQRRSRSATSAAASLSAMPHRSSAAQRPTKSQPCFLAALSGRRMELPTIFSNGAQRTALALASRKRPVFRRSIFSTWCAPRRSPQSSTSFSPRFGSRRSRRAPLPSGSRVWSATAPPSTPTPSSPKPPAPSSRSPSMQSS